MPNEYVNKVEFGNETVMDITDTTAETGDVLEGEVFYTKSGARSVGTLGDATQSVHGLMSAEDKTKLDSLSSYSVMTGATSSTAGASGLVPAPTTSDVNKFLAGDGTYKDGGKPMVILSYGSSTWNDFINAYNSNVIVYCRASSNSNPATGSQTRMAFMAYVNNATTPTEVEFQYYRSVSSHTNSQQGDQVFVYKLTSSGTWTVTTREAMARIVAGTNMSSTYSNNVLTINGNYSAMTGASSSTAGVTGLVPAPSAGDDGKFLKGDGTWDNVPNPQVMTGATSSTAGTSGLVPAPSSGDNTKFLKGDGTWAIASETVYGNTINMSSSDSTKIATAIGIKVDKVSSATSGNFAGLDANGNLTDSGHKHSDYLTSHQDISGKADKVSSATSGNFASLDANGNLTDSGHKHSDYLTSHQNISGKADKVSNATSGNFAGLDSNGNLTDSGKKASDFLTSHQDISGKADKADTVLTTTLSRGRKSGMSVGTRSFAFGDNVIASGTDSYAQGSNTTASEELAHAEGRYTTANGYYSHAEGNYTTASGMASHAEGTVTTATHANQHVFGEYNVEDGSSASAVSRGNYVEIVGNGTGSSAKSNARALDWDGNEYLKGDLYVGCNANSTSGTKIVSTIFEGATSSTAGSKGYVPAPSIGDGAKFLRGDGTWADAGGTVYGNTIDMSSTDSTKVSKAIDSKAPIIICDTGKSYGHDSLSDVTKITFHGNSYAFKNARYTNRKNLAPTENHTYETIGVTVECYNGFFVLNGTATGTGCTNAVDQACSIPAGNYKAYIDVDANGATLAAKTFEFVVWYSDDSTETFEVSVATEDVVLDMTFTDDVKRMRVRPGIRKDVVYDDYTFWAGVYPADVTIINTNLTVPSSGTAEYEAAISDAIIDTMQHESVVSYKVDTKEYIDVKADKVDTVLETTLSRGRRANTTVGVGSSAFGGEVTASGSYSHGEGVWTTASGYGSHAEGSSTTAFGNYAHAEGVATVAQRKSQHTFGEYNMPDSTGTASTHGDYIEIVGNGTSTSSRSNARTLDWDGNERLNGDLYVNCNDDSTGGTKVVATAFTGATSSTAGAIGLVPAPSFGDQEKFLRGDGTWADTSVNSGLYTISLDNVVQTTSGSYTHTTTVSNMTGDLKAVNIECGNPLIFLSPINIATSTGGVTLSCSNVAVGESTVKVSFIVTGNFNPLSSMEYNALDARVGSLSNLDTSDKTDVVSAINEVNSRSFPLLTPSEAFNIPSVGTPVIYDMEGITANHELIRWNFSESSENSPPVSLEWTTYDGYFMISNISGTTNETMKPVFARTVGTTITQHVTT